MHIRAWMSSKFGQMRPLVFMATDRVTVGEKGVITFSRTFLIGSLFILAGNDDIYMRA